MDSRIEIRRGRFIHLRLYKNPASDTTIFLIHGLGGRGAQWREQIDVLKDHYTLVVPDLYGHGNSDKPRPGKPSPYQFSEFDQDLQSLFCKFANTKNILIGHSYGGALATSLAIDHQDRVNALILIAPLPCTPVQHSPSIYLLPAFALELLRPWLELQFQHLAFDRHAPPALLKEELEAGKMNPLYVIQAMVNDMKVIPRIDITMLTIPVLLIHGEQDGIVPVSSQHDFYHFLPHCQFASIRQASHMTMLEQPMMVNQEIHSYLIPYN